jgi:hypothetical protein
MIHPIDLGRSLGCSRRRNTGQPPHQNDRDVSAHDPGSIDPPCCET